MISELPQEGIVQTTKVVRLINIKSSDREARESIRFMAYNLFREGMGVCGVARQLGVHAVTVSRWFKAFRAGDCSLLKGERPRGPVTGRRSLLDKKQLDELQNILKNKVPVEFALPYRRWSFAAVVELVKIKFGLEVSRVTAGKWLAECRLEK